MKRKKTKLLAQAMGEKKLKIPRHTPPPLLFQFSVSFKVDISRNFAINSVADPVKRPGGLFLSNSRKTPKTTKGQ